MMEEIISNKEVIDFLKSKSRGILAINNVDGYPLQFPIWLLADKNGQVVFNSPQGREWPSLVRINNYFCSILINSEDKAVEFIGKVKVEDDEKIARKQILELTKRVYSATSKPEMTQDLFKGKRLAKFTLIPQLIRTIGI